MDFKKNLLGTRNKQSSEKNTLFRPIHSLPSHLHKKRSAKREGLTLISSANLIASPVTAFFHLLQYRISKNAVFFC